VIRGGRALCLAAALALGLAAPAARGQQPNREHAADAFQKAVAFFEAGDFAGALSLFRAAYDAAPSYEVLWNIGLCQRRLNLYGEAVATFEAYLREGGKRLSKERRAAVAEELEKVRALTATISVRARVVGEVTIDGERVGFTPLEKFRVGPGLHTVKVTREGHQSFEETRPLNPGDAVILEAPLAAIAGYVKGELPPLPRKSPIDQTPKPVVAPVAAAPPPPLPVIGGVLLGAGAAFVGGGIAFEASSRAVSAEITGLFSSGGTWDQRWVQKQQWGQDARGLGVACFVTGSGLLLTGALLLTAHGIQARPTPTLTLAPLPGGGFVSVGGRF
jgi:PEGA domain